MFGINSLVFVRSDQRRKSFRVDEREILPLEIFSNIMRTCICTFPSWMHGKSI